MKIQSFKWFLLLGVAIAGCEDVTPLPVTTETAKTAVITDQQSSGENSNSQGTGIPNTALSNPSASSPSPSAPQAAPAKQTPVTPVESQPVIPFTLQTEGQTAHNLHKPLNSVHQYLAYVPANYNAQPNKKWPVVIFLHGSGELGNDVNKIFWTYFAWKTQDKKYPYILITPQLLSGNSAWSAADLNKMLDEILPKYNVDPSRIILTGYSLGAHGAWDWAEYNPNKFAAVVPVSGWGNVSKAYTLKNLPIWAFHGDADKVVNVKGSINMVNAIKTAGGTKAKLTVYPGRGHDAHSITYDNPDLINWILQQHR